MINSLVSSSNKLYGKLKHDKQREIYIYIYMKNLKRHQLTAMFRLYFDPDSNKKAISAKTREHLTFIRQLHI